MKAIILILAIIVTAIAVPRWGDLLSSTGHTVIDYMIIVIHQ